MQDETIPYGYCQCGCGEKTKVAARTRTARGETKGQPQQFVRGHALRRDPVDCIMEKVAMQSDDCWIFTGSLGGGGYGKIAVDRKARPAHRVMYERLVGPVPDGMVLDHLCSVRTCVNPAHLEPVTQRENVLRSIAKGDAPHMTPSSHCRKGHEFTPENTQHVIDRFGRPGRRCRRCVARNQRAYKARRAWRVVR